MWEAFVSLDAHNVVAQGRSMKPEERYGFLSQWVFPDRSAGAVRLYGDFAPADTTRTTASAQPSARLVPAGNLEAPALGLVALAKSLGRLDELKKRVQQIKPASNHDKRAKLGMLALVRGAQSRDGDAADALRQLMPLLEKVEADEPRWVRWPELLAVSTAIHRPALRCDALALLDQMASQVDKMTPEQRQLGPGLGYAGVPHPRSLPTPLESKDQTVLDGNSDLQYWKPVTHARARRAAAADRCPVGSCKTAS